MRGLYSSKTKIRHQIFTEIARMAYEEDGIENLEKLPYKIIPGEIATYRDSIFLERAVVGERLRVAIGLGLPDVLALGAATYPPAARISAAATGSLGKRTATLSSPPVVSIGTISDF